MRNIACAVVGGLVASTIFAGNAPAATVLFSDGFENQTDPLGAPPVGESWSPSGGGNIDLSTNVGPPSRVLNGTTSIKQLLGGSYIGLGNSGGLVAGNTVEYVFNVNVLNDGGGDPSHTFNAPVQIALGFSNGSLGQLARIGLIAPGGENEYAATNGATIVASSVTALANTAGFDKLRAVLTLTSPAAGQIGGTYDVFVSRDGGAETQIADDFALTPKAIPDGPDVDTLAGDDTRPAFSISRGGSSASPFYDDISITATAPAVPEPAALGLGAAAFGMLLARRNRR